MSRIANAWRALMGELPLETVTEKVVEVEKVVEKKIPVIGDAATVKLYSVSLPTGESETVMDTDFRGSTTTHTTWLRANVETKYFLTCHQAHTAAAEAVWPEGARPAKYSYEAPRAAVTEVRCILLGGEYFPFVEFMRAVKVEPKPKRAKGAK